MKKTIALILLHIFLYCAAALADTHFLATNGTDSGDCTQSPCLTMQYAFGRISSGDILEIADGLYEDTGRDGHDNFITNAYAPPSGPGTGTGDERFTIIKARNAFGVTIDLAGSGTGFWTNRNIERDYLKFDGIIFKSDVDGKALINFGWGGDSQDCDHIYFKRCGFAKENSSGAAYSTVWVASRYMLFEDCFYWGSGKYLLHERGDYNVHRRCVYRADNLNGGGQPCAVVMSYEGNYIEWQNIILTDADRHHWENYSYMLGAFATHSAADQNGTDFNYIRGAIAINNDVTSVPGGANNGFWISGNTSENNYFYDSVIIGGSGGGFAAPSGAAINNFAYNCLTANLSDTAGRARGFYGFETILDSIAFNNEFGFHNGANVNYSTSHGNGQDWSATTHTNDVNGDPTANGLLYPVRIESGSFLAAAGSGSGRVGPDITKKIGADGTFYGESNYNTTTSDDLWPWPHEAVIRSTVRAYSPGSLDGRRGFCADGQTLTKYIWEALGNSIPDEIYPDGPPVTTVPSRPANLQLVD